MEATPEHLQSMQSAEFATEGLEMVAELWLKPGIA